MDLNQRRLTKMEWDSIEIPVLQDEKNVLDMIIAGYQNVNIRINKHDSLICYLKIDYSEKMEDYLFNKYFRSNIDEIEKNLRTIIPTYRNINLDTIVKLNSVDKIRLERNSENNIKNVDIYEFVLIKCAEKMVTYKMKNTDKKMNYYYYSLYKLLQNNVEKMNRHVVSFCKNLIECWKDDVSMSLIIENAVDFIEKNENLLKYSDLTLYQHQKDIFTMCKNPNPKLILYMAPTGTGKTLTPLALSEGSRIIFVCAARHVGLALARAAISVNKKIAFAFGCSSADDIRLHYFAAKEYTKNKRSGGIGKVDNSVGDDVEMIICDIKSYLPAMFYMLAFNPKEKIIMYWDEPTITLDYQQHDFHKIIKSNWKNNLIPNVVLSSATLPKLHELNETISDFRNKFDDSEIYNIVSHDCKKSIPIINKDGFVVLPHYLHKEYNDILSAANHCEEHLTLLRYFDLDEICQFVSYVLKINAANPKMNIERHFESFDEIDMKNIKMYYVKLLKNIRVDSWETIYNHFIENRTPKILSNETVDTNGNKIVKSRSIGPGVLASNVDGLNGSKITRLQSEIVVNNTTPVRITPKIGTSGVYVSTKDAYTLTDGPTIFISNDIEKISKFCIQQANIPALVMDDIMKKIEYNNVINDRLHNLENDLDHINEKSEQNAKNDVSGSRLKSTKNIRKFNREGPEDDERSSRSEIKRITEEINTLRSMVKSAVLNDAFVPNKPLHLSKWASGLDVSRAFTSDVDEATVNDIMMLNGIENSWKVLLMMGIGVFINHPNISYTEIMKRLADSQKLYMIVASSDYIYGTNYQFCHGFLSKDLDLTQEKIIQAMGRIGRNNVQQNYTVRFRDDTQILKLFTSETEKPEIINMNILFNSNTLVWDGTNYQTIEEEEDQE
jgi:hypothetical protein